MEKQNFCAAIFGKNLKDLQFEDIESFFYEEQVETSFLEFKSGNAHIEKLIQEICAFLNTGGGVLVLGAPKENTDKKCIGSLTEVTCCNNEDQLSRKISGNISPLPTGIEYHQIKHKTGCSYIIEIQPSSYAPHQDNKSGIYFIRINEEKKAAPHSLVESLIFKRQRPKFNLGNGNLERNGSTIKYNGSVINEAPYPADRVSHLVTVNGVKSCASSEFKEIEPFNFRFIRQIEYSLIQEIQWLFDFEFEAYNKDPFLISHLVWSKEGKPFQAYIIVEPLINEEPTYVLFDDEKSAIQKFMSLRQKNLNQLIHELDPKNKLNYGELKSLITKKMKDYSIFHEKGESCETYSYFASKSDFVELIFTMGSTTVDITLKYSVEGKFSEVQLNPPR